MMNYMNSATEPKAFVDFDYTLFRSNSSEQFIAFSRPGMIVAAIDFLVRGCIPWRFLRDTNGCRLRDWFCCLAIVMLTPWNYFRWRRAAPALYQRLRNEALEAELLEIQPQSVVIVTFGMTFVVRALLAGSPWAESRLVGTPLLPHPRLFYRGKHNILREIYSDDCLTAALGISDSEDDRDLLDATRGRKIERQGDLFASRQTLYMPLRYMAAAKYTRSYTVDQILFVDILLAIVATAFDLHSLLVSALVLPFFVLSAACIYEIGYFENDVAAALKEAKPTLTDAAAGFVAYPIEPAAWIWASGFAAVGFLIAHLLGLFPDPALPWIAAGWAGALVVIRLVFHLYNAVGTDKRLFLYPVLQATKYLYLPLILPLTPAGAVVVAAQITAMWLVYVVYRLGGNKRGISREATRAMLGAIGLPLIFLASREPLAAIAFQFALVSAWLVARLAKAHVLTFAKGLLRRG